MNEFFAHRVIETAQATARKHGFAVCISVVDAAGLLCGFVRMDDAVPGAIDVSMKKARTAALFRTDSLELGAAARPGGPIYTLEASNGGLISFGGGVVLYDEQGKAIGAVGVAGATVDADQDIAMHAAGRS